MSEAPRKRQGEGIPRNEHGGGTGEAEQAFSALEQALRDALAVATPDQVRRRVDAMVPRTPIEVDTGASSRFHGRVQKVSVSMPEDLTATVRERVGAGAFSRYVTEATEERLRLEMLDEYLDELDAEYGPVPRELLDWAERQWRDHGE
jgi:hypothetical protein